ncbi:sodium-dependent glucose transporter 1-like [Brevipalpus obovatus]|uniref:sodium-dependent glucose transporter 1-like n=1 Tax=Brevipalpus obovatus TaxID=246614 RepID=UPI003D9E8F70
MNLSRNIQINQKRLILSILIYFGYGLFALRSQTIGSSLLDFEIQIQEPFMVTSRAIGLYAIGSMFGSVIYGFFDKKVNIHLVQIVTCVSSGITIGSIPFMRNFLSLGASTFLLGIENAIFHVVCNLAILTIWSKKASYFLQFLGMFYGIGSMLAPMLVLPFLLPIPKNVDEDWNAIRAMYTPDDVQIKWPYTVIGVLSVVAGLTFVYFYFDDDQQHTDTVATDNKERNPKVEENSGHVPKTDITDNDVDNTNQTSSKLKILFVVIWVAIQAHLVFSFQLILCSFVQAFGVRHTFKMEKKSSALVASLFWAAYMISKLIFVILSMTIGEAKIVNLCYTLTGTALILLLSLANYYEMCLWIACGALELGYSPLFALSYASLDNYFQVTGRQTSFIFLVGILGESLHTTIVGALMDQHPPLFIYYVGTLGTIFLLMTISLPFLCKRLFGDPDKKRLRIFVSKAPVTRLASLNPSLGG